MHWEFQVAFVTPVASFTAEAYLDFHMLRHRWEKNWSDSSGEQTNPSHISEKKKKARPFHPHTSVFLGFKIALWVWVCLFFIRILGVRKALELVWSGVTCRKRLLLPFRQPDNEKASFHWRWHTSHFLLPSHPSSAPQTLALGSNNHFLCLKPCPPHLLPPTHLWHLDWDYFYYCGKFDAFWVNLAG